LSWTNKAGLNICQPVCTHSMSVRPQKLFRLEQNLYVVRGWWQHMTVCRMTRSNIKVEVMEIWNVRKWPISKAISSANNMHAIKRLMVNYDTPRQYLNFNWTDFWYSSSFSITWPSNLGCSTFGKRNLPLTRSRPSTSWQSCTGFIFFCFRVYPSVFPVLLLFEQNVNAHSLVLNSNASEFCWLELPRNVSENIFGLI